MSIYLSDLIIYPIKSLAGVHVQQWQVNAKGLLYDRKWMLIDENNKFLSQRRFPKMVLIHQAIEKDRLILSAPGMEDKTLSLNDAAVGEEVMAEIWHDRCLARFVSEEMDRWFSQFLETPCRLVYQPENATRAVDPRYGKASDQVHFTDEFPFLIISEGSLEALNEAMGITLTMARFRPNLVIANCEAYAEDTWRKIRVGEINFRLPKPCARCGIPAINPSNAEITKEPLATLSRLRKWQGEVYFGQNALPDTQGILKLGDEIIINEIGKAQPPLSS